ncbi:hypothetical protein SADUNF_Sadunf04G0094000 [Salix dunnii]|uniref:Reverse transcriptase zinc-binding domain-containing protein n=1 Tax=Salix dunnii TaxID=1413687 RepID=A0A835KBI4_9ROSI|nr:hypothetical protein SADUNF_Sadunf04G0094000 [Salix dunnii]
MQSKLRTKDRLWSTEESTFCSLCGTGVESHDHLFFQCPYAKVVWTDVNQIAHTNWAHLAWDELTRWAAINFSAMHNHSHLVARLTLSAVVYYVWFERNNRIFNGTSKTPISLVAEIHQLLRLHLSAIKLKHPLSEIIKTRWGLA